MELVKWALLAQFGLTQEFDQVLQQARQHPSPVLAEDHQKARDTVAKLLNEEKFDEALAILKAWKPTGLPN